MKSKVKNTALKKIVPAVAMLAMSATMLSTATYAWFTMSKEVKMTGLNMTATVSEGIEISLASVTGSNELHFSGESFYKENHPKDDDNEKGWKSSVLVGQYYDKIGKLKPASSVNAENLYYATDASDKGRQASTFDPITLGDAAMADLTPFSTLAAESTVVSANETSGTEGYYVDIPVHIRTTKKAATDGEKGPLYCKLIIKNSTTDNDAAELYKAIRVAFVPITTGTDSTTKIFGIDDTYFDSKVVGDTGDLVSSTDVVTKNFVDATFLDGDGVDSGLNLPLAPSGQNYGHLDFYVRVWLEGQSTSCFDDNAGQSWNIDLAFSLDKFGTSNP